MKKFTYLVLPCLLTSLLFFNTISSFGQSVTIIPEQQLIDNSWGDNIKLSSNSSVIGIQSFRYRGTSLSKSGVLANDDLFRIGGGGYFNPFSLYTEKAAVFFRASQNWTDGASGAKIDFLTTANNTTNLVERMTISNAGNIGIANQNPAAKLHINHLATGDSPHLQLNSTGTSPAIITTTSTAGSMWLNYFLNGSTPASNIVYWSTSIS